MLRRKTKLDELISVTDIQQKQTVVKTLPAALSVKQSCHFCFTDPGFEEDVQYKCKAKEVLCEKGE